MANNSIQILLSAQDKTGAAFASLNRNLSGIARQALDLKGVLGGLTAALSVGAIASFVKGAIDAADEMGKLAQKAGVSVKAMSELSYAGKLADVSNQQLATGLQKLSRNILDTSAGTGEAAKAFKALGISVKDSSGNLKSSDAVLKEVAGKFAGMEDGAAKTALAIQIFGRGGAELIPLLNAGKDGLEAMAREAEELGLVLDERAAKRAEQFNDTLTTMHSAAGGIAQRVAGEMLPTFNSLAGQLLATAKDTNTLSAAADFLSGVLKSLVSVGILIKNVFEIVGKSVAGVAAAVVAAVQGNFGQAWDILKQSGQDVADDMKDIAKGVSDVWSNAYQDTGAATADLVARQRAAAKAAEEYAKVQENAAGKTKKAIDYYDKYMERELDAAVKMQEEMVKAYDKARLEERVEAEKMLADAIDATNERLNEQAMANSDAIKTSEDMIRAIELETHLMGLSNDERAKTVALLELEKQKAGLTAEEYAEYTRRLEEALSANAAKRAAVEGAEKAKEEWKRAAASIEQSLTDALMRGFESGKDFGKNLVDTLKNLFNTLILRPIIQSVAQMGSQMVLGSLGMGGSSAALAGQAGSSMLGGGSSWLGTAGTSLMSGAALSGMSTGWGMAMANIGAGGYFGAMGTTLATAGTSLGMGGIGTAIGMAAPYLLPALGALALFSAFKDKGNEWDTVYATPDDALAGRITDKHGADALQTFASGLEMGRTFKRTDGEQSAELLAAFAQLDQALYSLTAADMAGKISGDYGYNKAAGGYVAGGRVVADMDQVAAWFVSDWVDAAETVPEAVQAALDDYQFDVDGVIRPAQDLVDALAIALADTGELFGADAVLASTEAMRRSGESLAQTYQRVAAEMQAADHYLGAFGQSLGAASLATAQATEALVAAAGGLEAFTAKSEFFWQNYYTEAERAAYQTGLAQQALDAFNAEMGLSGAASIASRDALRVFVEALDLTTASGQAAYAAAMGVAEALAYLTATAEAGSLQSSLSSMQSAWAVTQSSATQMFSLSGDAGGLEAILASLQSGYQYLTDMGDQSAVLDQIVDTEQQINQARASAQADQIAATETQIDNARAMLEAAKDIKTHLDGLRLGVLSPLSPERRLAEAESQYAILLAQAKNGDAEAAGKLSGAADAYLSAAKDYSASGTDYARVFNSVTSDLGQFADSAIATNERLVDTLETELNQQLSVSQRTYDQVRSLYEDSMTAFRQQLDAATREIVATDNVKAALEQLPPELAGILSASVAQSVAPLLSQYAGVFNRALPDASLTSLTSQVAAGETTIAAAKDGVIEAIYGLEAGGAQAARDWVQQQLDAGDPMSVYLAAKEKDVPLAGLDALMGAPAGSAEEWARANGLPVFDVGTNFVPKDMVAQIHAGERIIPAADNAELMARLRDPQTNNAVLVAELKALREEVVLLRAEARATVSNTGKTAALLDRAMPDGDALATRAAA